MAVRPQERLECRGDHQFDISLCQNAVRILPVEDLSLFGDFDLTAKCARRLRYDRAMGWPSAAADRSSASMKQLEFDTTFTCASMKRLMGLVQFPGARQHSAVFVGIGIAQHDF